MSFIFKFNSRPRRRHAQATQNTDEPTPDPRHPLALALLAGACGDDDPQNRGTPDAKVTTGTPDAPTSAPTPDAPPPGQFEPAIHIVPVSSTGPDRFFGVAFDAQSHIYAVGQVADSTNATADIATVIARFTPAGVLDDGFADHGLYIRNVAAGANGEIFRSIVVQSDGKVVVAGTIEHEGDDDPRDRDVALIRLQTDGTPDDTFGDGGTKILDLSTGAKNGDSYVSDVAWGLDVYPDDRLVVSGGRRRGENLDTDYVLVRLSKGGQPDDDFADHGVFALDLQITDTTAGNVVRSNSANPRNVKILPGTGGIVAAGYQPIPGRDTEPVVYHVDDAGHLDESFGTNGAFVDFLLDEQAETYSARPQGDKLVTTGYGRDTSAQTTDILSLRLTADGKLDDSYGDQGMVRIDVGGFGDNSRFLNVLPDQRILLVGGGRPSADNVDGFIALLTENGQPDTSFSATGWKTFDLGGPADFTIGVGGNFGTNAIGAVDHPSFHQSLQTGGGQVSLAWTVSPRDLVDVSYSLSYLNGYQASPYRFVIYGGDLRAVPEIEPDIRWRHAVTARWNHHVARDMALRTHLRGYVDDWGIASATTGSELVMGFGALDVAVHARGYVQRHADFYRPSYDTPTRYMTSDRELATFVDVFAGAQVSWHHAVSGLGTLALDAGVDGFTFWFDDFPRLRTRAGLVANAGVGLSF